MAEYGRDLECPEEAPTGMLFIDESALATDGVKNLVLDGSGSLMVEVSGIVADETFDDDFPDSPTVNVIDGDVVSISYDTDVLRDAEFVLGQRQDDANDWFCAGGGPCDVEAAGIASQQTRAKMDRSEHSPTDPG